MTVGRRAALWAACWACSGSLAAAAPAADPGPWLVFDVANSVYTTNPGGNFVVEVRCGARREIVHRVVWGSEPGVWLPQAVNLRDYAGQTVRLRLQTIAAYSYSNACFLFWGRPRIVLGPLDSPAAPDLVADLTEWFRQGRNCRRYVLDAEASAPLKTEEYDFTGGYYEDGQAGPWAEPALFGHPFCFGRQGWAGYEFEVTLPLRPGGTPAPAAPPVPSAAAADIGRLIPAFSWAQQVYRGAPEGSARVDPSALHLDVRMPRTDAGLGYAFAGLETRGCRWLWLRTQFDRYEPWTGYGEMTDNRFAGVVLDYHTPTGYSRRVWLHLPALRPEHPERRCERRAPTWHLDLARPRRVLEANWEQLHADLPLGSPPQDGTGAVPAAQIIGLDLERWAPCDWDGRIWFGIGLQDAGSQRRLSVAILDRQPDAVSTAESPRSPRPGGRTGRP